MRLKAWSTRPPRPPKAIMSILVDDGGGLDTAEDEEVEEAVEGGVVALGLLLSISERMYLRDLVKSVEYWSGSSITLTP